MSTTETLRWYTKKAARRGVVETSRATRTLRRAESVAEVRVVTYHRFGDDWPRDAFCVSAAAFDEQMAWLASNDLAVSLADVEAFVNGERDLAPGSVLVTMDDGVESVRTVAAPILEQHGIPAVAFVSSGLIENAAAGYEQPEPYMTWDGLSSLPERGITVAAHGHLHRSMGQIPIDEARIEATTARTMLQDRLGVEVDSFAYPYGTPTHYTDATRDALADAGYRTGFTSLHGPVVPGLDPLVLPRVKVEGGEGLGMFKQVCRGGMDRWAAVDHAVAAVRARRAEPVNASSVIRADRASGRSAEV